MEVETVVLKWVITEDQNHKMLLREHGGCTVIHESAVQSFSDGISCIPYHFESI
jgi:hypothetical protein